MPSIDIYSDMENLLDMGADMIQFYRNNPCIAAYDLLKVDLAPIQRIVLNDMWFKNYTITIATRGFGKSQSIDSLSYVYGKGLNYLYEFLPKIPSYLKDGYDDAISWQDDIYTSDGFHPIKRVSLEKGIKGLCLTTQNGFENKGSYHHRLLTINNTGEFIYKRLDEFNIDDYVCIQRDQQVFGDGVVSDEDAYLIGLFIGDGHIKTKNAITITSEDAYIKSFCISYCKKNNILYRIDDDKRTKNTSKICFKKFDYFFEKYNIKRDLSYFKEVPYTIRSSNRKAQLQFLRGYFDTDGTVNSSNGGVSCCSTSYKLLKEIQLLLLNFGIVSRVRRKKTKSRFGKAYLLDMFFEDALKFKKLIGFNLSRKQIILNNYFDTRKVNPNKDIIPYVKDLCVYISKRYRELNAKNKFSGKLPTLKTYKWNTTNYTYSRLDTFIKDINKLMVAGYKFDQDCINVLDIITNINNRQYYFDKIKLIENWQGDCYDFEMDMPNGVEPNYFTNGFINHNTFILGVNAALHALLYPGYRVGLLSPSFRQSKMIFAEIEKIYNKSSILREACEKRPVRGADTCNLRFKGTDLSNGSFIEALPVGVDGAKIRGSRFYLIEIDELAQMPSDIIDMVIRPMAAVVSEPMQKVREIQRIEQLIKEGLATEDDLLEESANKMVMTSSGYFKFNHMWHRMKTYWKAIKEDGRKKSEYAVHQIPYNRLPKGFLDMKNVNEAKRTMSSIEFMMEYEASMVSDSEGFFKASLLDTCTRGSDFTIKTHGEPGKEYVIGIDPNQGGSALFGIVVVELGHPNKVVYVKGLKSQAVQDMTKSIHRIIKNFNIVRIYMDAQGGGSAIKDLLAEGYNNETPILDMDDDITRYKTGRRILRLVNFAPVWISDANFNALSLLENNRLRFPESPRSNSEIDEKLYEDVRLLKSQMLNIVVTETQRGVRHFDTPKKGQNKDLYSAILLASFGVTELNRESDIVPMNLEPEGLIRPHAAGAHFTRQIGGGDTEYLSKAVLHRKI